MIEKMDGYADIELGIELRFFQGTDARPQMGIFPVLLFPTGGKNKHQGAGEMQNILFPSNFY
jgi:hypothetical protein